MPKPRIKPIYGPLEYVLQKAISKPDSNIKDLKTAALVWGIPYTTLLSMNEKSAFDLHMQICAIGGISANEWKELHAKYATTLGDKLRII